MKQLLLCFWAYASCHVTECNKPWAVNPCKQAHSLFFLKVGNLRWYSSPQPRFLPRYGLWGDHQSWSLDQRLPNFPRVHSDSFCSCKNCKTSEGLLWLGTLSIHKGMSKPSSTSKMTLIMSSLLSLADHVLRKEPLTDSLSVNRTAFRDFRKLCHDLTAARTAIISNSCMTVFCPLDMISFNVSLSTVSLKKTKSSLTCLLPCPRGHCTCPCQMMRPRRCGLLRPEGIQLSSGHFWARGLWSRSDNREFCQTESACQPWHGSRGPSAVFWSVGQTSVNLRTEDALLASLHLSEGASLTSLLRRSLRLVLRPSQQCLLQSKCRTPTASSQVGLPELCR